MSSILNLNSTPSALAALNVHAHGRKHGLHAQSTDDSSSAASGQTSTGPVQNLFGSLLQSVEQVIGLQTGATAAQAVAAGVVSAADAVGNAAASSTAGSAASHSARSLLQNYLNNLSHPRQPNGLQAPQAAGTAVRENA